MSGVLPLARELGDLLEAREIIPAAEPIETRVYRPTRKDIWPPEEWAKMQRIMNGEEDEGGIL